jgi:hypothetical protein
MQQFIQSMDYLLDATFTPGSVERSIDYSTLHIMYRYLLTKYNILFVLQLNKGF